MPTKIRLQRFGKKRYPFYHVVVADSRAPRDGKFIEKLGIYNPNVNPANIDIDFERSLHWVKTGAEPSDTARSLLSYKGVMHKDHLDRGVLKGAFSQEEADKKFADWMKEKENKINSKIEGLNKSKSDKVKERLENEKKVNEKKSAEILLKNTPPPVEEEAPKAAEAAPANETAPPAENTEAKTEETAPVKEEVVVEAKEDAPQAKAAEEKKEETPKEETKEEDKK